VGIADRFQATLAFVAQYARNVRALGARTRRNLGEGEGKMGREAPRIFGKTGIDPRGHAIADGDEAQTHYLRARRCRIRCSMSAAGDAFASGGTDQSFSKL